MREPDRWQHLGPSLTDTVHVRLFTCRAQEIGPEWASADVLSSYWRLYRNAGDGASLRLAEGVHPLTAGRIHLVPAGVTFSCQATRHVPHFYLHFDLLGLSTVTLRELFAQPLTLAEEPALEAAADWLADRAGGGGLAVQCRAKGLIFAALASYLAMIPAELLARCSRLDETQAPVRPALDWIAAHLSEPICNRELAALCCVCEDHLIRLFRQHVGQTPAQFIRERRLMQAAQQLLFTSASIDQIAARCGFGNRSYFTRAFTAYTGLPPGAYRRARQV